MRFLIAIALLVTIAASSKVARPHVTGYAETKHALNELANALDSLAYVFAVKGIKTYPLCGLQVPTLGAWAASPKLDLYSQPKPAPATYSAPAKPSAPATPYGAPAAPAAPATGYKTDTNANYAVVKYPNKKALDDALLEASAEIVADDAAVRAKIDEIKYLQLKENSLKDAGDNKGAASVETKLADDRKSAEELEVDERKAKDDKAKLDKAASTGDGKIVAATAVVVAPKTCDSTAGKTLCDKDGNTLYVGPDECTGDCANFWPVVPAGSISGEGIASSGGHATYKGRTLHRFSLDPKPGVADGHNSNGFKICSP